MLQVVSAANDNPYGLASGILAKDQHVIDSLVRKLRAGTVWVNTYNIYDAGRRGGQEGRTGPGRGVKGGGGGGQKWEIIWTGNKVLGGRTAVWGSRQSMGI